MSTEPQRTCPTCGNELSGATEYCPVCMLRKALAGGVESGQSCFEDTVKPTTPEQAVQRFEHYELVTGADGRPVELGRGAMGVTYKAFRHRPALRKAALVLVAVEKRGRVTGRARMAVIPDFKKATLLGFPKENVVLGSTVNTDGLKSFAGLQQAGFQHVPRSQRLRIDLRKGVKSVLPLVDHAIGNLQQWLIGTITA